MKRLFTLTILLAVIFIQQTSAQSDERRNKIQLVVNFGGKTVTTDVNSMNTAISRAIDQEPIAKDTLKNSIGPAKTILSEPYYLSFELKMMNPDLLNIISKRQNRFDGTITITDSYGKNPTKTIKFKGATLYTYSEQLSEIPYSGAYGSCALSITCKELIIDGVNIE